MIVKDPRFITPAWNTIIWRYMTLEKFLDIILSSHLYFTNTSMMTDRNECEIPKGNEKQFFSQNETESISQWCDFHDRKRSSFINCWIINRFESYAQWKIYLGGAKNGVAIKTNIKNLITAVNKTLNPFDETIYAGKVKYTDFIKSDLCIEELITTKNHFYAFENEFRLIILREPEFEQGLTENKLKIIDGIQVTVDPLVLIDEIYVSPFGGSYFRKILESTIREIRPNFASRIKKSEIKDS
jgi:hypothetical protein